MTIDWSPIAAGASAVGAIAALGVYFAGKQIRTSVVIAKDTQDIAKQTQGIDVLLRLRDEWDAETMQEKKQRAASLLLRNLPDEGSDAADVFDFFETVAVFINRNVIDPYLAWHTFYWWMVNFYAAARGLTSVGGRLRSRTEAERRPETMETSRRCHSDSAALRRPHGAAES